MIAFLVLLLCVPALAEDRQVSLASILGPDKARHIMDQERAVKHEIHPYLAYLLFDDIEAQVYLDAVHLWDLGNQIIARRLAEALGTD